MNNFIYFKFEFKSKKFFLIEIKEFTFKKELYQPNSILGCFYIQNNKKYILDSCQLDTALFYRDKNYLRNFLRTDFSSLYNELECFDWIQENKNIIRRLIK